MNILVVYGSTDGHTAKIAHRIGARLHEAGHSIFVEDIRALPLGADPSKFDAILVGGSLHLLRYQRRVRRFIAANRDVLNRHPSGFFSVCMAIASKKPEDRARAWEIPRDFLAAAGWAPDLIHVFAGAVSFTRYGFFRRTIMHRISREETGVDLDPKVDHVFTNWTDVDSFAQAFAALANEREVLAEHPPI